MEPTFVSGSVVKAHITGVCPICGAEVESTKFKEGLQGNKFSWCPKHGYVRAVDAETLAV